MPFKITVLKKNLDEELAGEYCQNEVTPCPVFEEGQEFIALNGGPVFTFSQATSFVINCENQEEIDFIGGVADVQLQHVPGGGPAVDRVLQLARTILAVHHQIPLGAESVTNGRAA